jgi:hypothetical protein
MSFLNDIKDRLFLRRFAKDAGRSKHTAAGVKTLHPEVAHRIAILFPADTSAFRKDVDQWRDRTKRPKRKIEVLGFFLQDVGNASFDFNAVSVKDLNWYGIPQGDAVKVFLDQSVDILIRLGPASHPALDYLSALKPAGLKVGPIADSPYPNPYHLQFDATTQERPRDQLMAIERIFSFTNAPATS